MADKPIHELEALEALQDEDLMVVEHNRKAQKMYGKQFAAFAREAAAADVQRAVIAANAAETAKTSAQQAETAAGGYSASAGNAASEAAQSARSAAAARQAVENMGVEAETLPPGSDATVAKRVAEDGTVTLRYGIPRGKTGEQGATGPQGGQGIQGLPGPRGPAGFAVATDTTYAFNVNEEGHLILYYTGTEAPDFEISSEGHLLLNLT